MSKEFIKFLLLLFLSNSISQPRLFAASASYCYLREVTLAGGSEKLTIQQSSAATRGLRFAGGSIYCSVACTVTLDRSGSPATAAQVSATKINSASTESSVNVFISSNAGAGTIINKFVLAPGQTLLIELSDMGLSSASDNLNFSTSAITGDVKIFLLWREQ